MIKRMLCIATLLAATTTCSDPTAYDVLIRGGTVYDGSGSAPFVGDVAIDGDRIVALGDLAGATAESVVDASGLAVSPGFVNMLSWSTESLIVDGRSQGELRQGVTLEVFGEGVSFGPMNADMKEEWLENFVDFVGSEQSAAELLGGRTRSAVDDARRLLGVPGEQRHLDQRRLLPRRDNRAHP